MERGDLMATRRRLGGLAAAELRVVIAVGLGVGVLSGTGCGDPGAASAGERDPGASSPQILALAAADSLYGDGEFETARLRYEEALRAARSASDVAAEARALTSLGLAAWRLGEHAEARRYGEEALALKRARGLDSLLFRSYNALGLLAWSESRFFDAVELYEAASEVAAARADTANLAKAANNLALVLSDLGEFERARHHFDRALLGARAVADTFIQGRVLNNLGMLAHQVGNPRQAIRHLEAARALYAASGDATGDQNALGQLGTVYASLGAPGKALLYLDSALVLSREQGLRLEEASNLELLAGVYAEAGDARRALRLLESAAAIDAELGLAYEAGVVLRRKAAVHARLGAYDQATRSALEALGLHREIGAGREERSDLILLAELAEEAGDRAAADEHLAAARRLAEESGSRAARVEVSLAGARVAEKRGDWARVLPLLDAIAEDLRDGGYRDEWEAYALSARAHARLGRVDEAIEAGRRAVHAAERVRESFGSGALRTSFLVERQRTYFDLVRALLSLDRPDEAFRVADRARGRALLEHLAATTDGEASGPVARLAEGEPLLRQIDTLVVRLEELRAEPAEGSGAVTERRLASELERKRSEYEALLTRVEASDPGAGLLLGHGVDPGEIVAALDPAEALLQYLVGEDRILLFAVTRAGVRVFDTPVERQSLIGRVRLVRDLLSRPVVGASDDGRAGGSGLTLVLSRLHELLFGSVRRAGLLPDGGRVILVPHAELSYVPFGALVDPSTGRYLAEDHALLHLPSSSALTVLRSEERSRGPAGREPPVAYAPFPEALPATVAEVAAFRRAVEEGRVRMGGRATETSFRASLARTPILHAATHGVLNRRNPMFTRIELARGRRPGPRDDGRLELHELLELPVTSGLVFLSGCETGLGSAWSTAFAPGEDYATLAQAFLYAGARSVVATLWRIEDEGAAALAEQFYERLASLAPAEALAGAQRALMEDPTFGTPFHWAAYRVTGG